MILREVQRALVLTEFGLRVRSAPFRRSAARLAYASGGTWQRPH